jgi:hypothetical protein
MQNLSEGGHQGKAYAPVGPEKVDAGEGAEHISAAAGRRIRHVE